MIRSASKCCFLGWFLMIALPFPAFADIEPSRVLAVSGEIQATTSYVLQRVSATSATGDASSSSYHVRFTTNVTTGAVGVCPAGRSATLGFWSVLGRTDVPIVLELRKTADNPATVELGWTGQSNEFVVYRGATAQGLADPFNQWLTTESCAAQDAAPDDENLLFYLVADSPGND